MFAFHSVWSNRILQAHPGVNVGGVGQRFLNHHRGGKTAMYEVTLTCLFHLFQIWSRPPGDGTDFQLKTFFPMFTTDEFIKPKSFLINTLKISNVWPTSLCYSGFKLFVIMGILAAALKIHSHWFLENWRITVQTEVMKRNFISITRRGTLTETSYSFSNRCER